MLAATGRSVGLAGRTVLVLDDGWSHTSITGAASLARAGCHVWSGSPAAGFLARTAFCERSLVVRDPAVDLAGFVEDVRDAIDRHGIDLVVPTSDREAIALATSGIALLTATAPGAEVQRGLYDKATLAVHAADAGLAPPATARVGRGDDTLPAWAASGPVVVKAALHWTPGATGGHHAVAVCRTPDEVRAAIAALQVRGVEAIVQEHVAGPIVNIAMVVDRAGELVAVGQTEADLLIRGANVLAHTTRLDVEVVGGLHRMLAAAGWFGCAQFDLIRDERTGVLRPIDFNGRWFMSMAAITAAGCDLAKIGAAVALGLPVTGRVVAQSGVRFRWPQALVVLGMLERDPRRVLQAFAPAHGAAHPYAQEGSRLAALRYDARQILGEARSMVGAFRSR